MRFKKKKSVFIFCIPNAWTFDFHIQLRNSGGLEPLVELLRSKNDEVRRHASWAVMVCASDELMAVELCRLGWVELPRVSGSDGEQKRQEHTLRAQGRSDRIHTPACRLPRPRELWLAQRACPQKGQPGRRGSPPGHLPSTLTKPPLPSPCPPFHPAPCLSFPPLCYS